MRQVFTIQFFLLLLIFSSSCKFFKKGKSSTENILAQVDDEYLYMEELQPMIKELNPNDSANFVFNYANEWVKKKLLLKKAEENISSSESGIDKKVEDYRSSLLLYEYEKELINQRLNNAISEEEIKTFYETNKGNFVLESDVFLVEYVIFSTQAKDLESMKLLILNPKSDDDYMKVEGYAKSMARDRKLGGDNWMTLSTFSKKLLIPSSEMEGLLSQKKFKEFSVNGESVFVRIKDVKRKGEITPMPFIQSAIKEMLINKKKVSLLESIYNKIFEDGQKNKEFEVFVTEPKKAS